MENQNSNEISNYCPSCGNEINPDDSFCGKCGRTIEYQKQEVKVQNHDTEENYSNQKEETEKNKKKIITAANFTVVLGWLRVTLPLPAYIILKSIQTSDGSYSSESFLLSEVVWTMTEGFLLIVLGERIKKQTLDLRKYIKALLFILIPITFIGFMAGGRGGDLLNFLLIVYLFRALSATSKLFKNKEYRDDLSDSDCTIKWFHWILIGVAFLILFFLASTIDGLSPNF